MFCLMKPHVKRITRCLQSRQPFMPFGLVPTKAGMERLVRTKRLPAAGFKAATAIS